MSAAVLQFPAKVQQQAKRRMNRVDLDARHRWTLKHAKNWSTEQSEGAEPDEYLSPQQRQLMKLLDKEFGTIKQPTLTELRCEIADGRKLIEKRNRVKAWLTSMGVDLDTVTTAEQALFFAFDHSQGRARA